MMRERLLVASSLVFALSLCACGTSSTVPVDSGSEGGGGGDDGTRDAAEADSSDGTAACPTGSIDPDAAIYTCEAGVAGSVGCQSPLGDQSVIYPEGCTLFRPQFGCAARCCATMGCTCQLVNLSGPPDGGLVFACGG